MLPAGESEGRRARWAGNAPHRSRRPADQQGSCSGGRATAAGLGAGNAGATSGSKPPAWTKPMSP